jgi:hypothetical protein
MDGRLLCSNASRSGPGDRGTQGVSNNTRAKGPIRMPWGAGWDTRDHMTFCSPCCKLYRLFKQNPVLHVASFTGYSNKTPSCPISPFLSASALSLLSPPLTGATLRPPHLARCRPASGDAAAAASPGDRIRRLGSLLLLRHARHTAGAGQLPR